MGSKIRLYRQQDKIVFDSGEVTASRRKKMLRPLVVLVSLVVLLPSTADPKCVCTSDDPAIPVSWCEANNCCDNDCEHCACHRGDAKAIAYKLAKEAFVSNLNGTSMTEVNIVIAALPISTWLHSEALSVIRVIQGEDYQASLSLGAHFGIEFLTIIVLPIICSTLAQFSLRIVLTCLLAAVVMSMVSNGSSNDRLDKMIRKDKVKNLDSSGELWRPNFLTNFRSSVMVATCISILAVDFPIYPRRFAKAERYGTGLMDIGVGAFIVSAGLVSGLKNKERRDQSFPDAILAASPMLVIGVVRFIAMKGVQYQEHVSEYGTHWNFFLTIAVVSLLNALLRPLVPHKTSLFVGIVLIVAYQYMLSTQGLSEFIMTAPREGFFGHNREGICGCLGFIAMHMLSQGVGEELHSFTEAGRGGVVHKRWRWNALFLICLDVLLWAMLSAVQQQIEPVSRRTVNLAYTLWVLAVSVALLAMLVLIDLFCYRLQPSVILIAINKNPLAVFLVANLSTGIVNLSTETIYHSDHVALGIMFLYMLFVTGTAVTLGAYGIRLR
jgi:phosphatidylinositol glycan class W